MNKYKIEIIEYMQRIIEQEAISEEETLSKVKREYYEGNRVLDYSDLTGQDIEIYNLDKSKLDILLERIDKFNKDRDWD